MKNMRTFNILHYASKDPLRCVTSNFLSLRVLFSIRIILTLYAIAVLIGSIVTGILTQEVEYVYYFTRLSYIGLVGYMISATVHTGLYMLQIGHGKRPPSYPMPNSLPKGSYLLQAHCMLYATVICNHIVVPIIYWSLLYSTSANNTTVLRWENFSQHLTDFVTILFEVVLNRMMLNWIELIVVLAVVLIYVFWMWLVRLFAGIWVYAFLGFNEGPSVAGWYIFVLVLFVMAFAVQYYFAKFKEWVAHRWGYAQKFKEEQNSGSDMQQNSGPDVQQNSGPDMQQSV